jgi:hypothetical protein
MSEEMKDLSELKKQNNIEEEIIDDPDSVDDDSPVMIITQDDIEKKKEEDEAKLEKKGLGVVIDNKVLPTDRERKMIKRGVQGATDGLGDKTRQQDIETNFTEIDNEIDKQRKLAEKNIANGNVPTKEINDPEASKAVKDANRAIHEQDENKANNARNVLADKVSSTDDITILIDKAGLGSFEFTPEEKERIEKAKRIKIVEVEEKKLGTLKIRKKIDSKDSVHLLQRNFDKSISPVVAIASGYTCKMKNISASEAIRMFQSPGEDTANSMVDKWSVIYDKITAISRGPFKDFEDFTKHTAFMDYDLFLYGMICSSYPEDDSISFNCDKSKGGCGKDFEHPYNNKMMIRSDLITDETKRIMAEIINNGAFVDKALEYANNSPVNNFIRYQMNDQSGIIFDLYIPSVYEMIERVFKKVDSDRDMTSRENRTNLILAQAIHSIYVPDYENFDESMNPEDVEYDEIEGIEVIMETLKRFNEKQISLLTNRIKKLTDPYTISFGFPKIVCNHCHHDWGRYDMELDNVLFHRVQQRVTTETV